jgi:ubiquinone/menaquinone biosynthesis C-methylase UbiE
MDSSFHLPPTVERFTGFASVYDQYRPNPPDALSAVLAQMTGKPVPDLVVDLGCGTGLSSRFWSERARQVIGVDPARDMLVYARLHTHEPNITYVFGFGHQVALASGCADVVTCSQALHWMEPVSTLAEIARLLRPGGVFAAYDHDAVPVIPSWELEAALQTFQERADRLETDLGVSPNLPSWQKHEHLRRLRESGHFRFTREFCLHHVEMGNADRFVGAVLSSGQIQSLLKAGVPAKDLGLDTLQEHARRWLGNELQPWYYTVRFRVAVK